MNDSQRDPLVKVEDDGASGPAQMEATGRKLWKVLIVDDEAEVHDATVFALSNLMVHGYPLVFLHAHNEPDARMLLAQNPDIAVVLLDVVMEAGDSGLRLVKHIRDDLKLGAVRIVLRTGQPGYAPELEVIQKYDINDYKTKLELTRTRLATTIIAAIRSFEQIRAISDLNASLELRVSERTAELQRVNRELESFSYSVAHDLRIPLRHILGFSDILRERLVTTRDADSGKIMESITRAAVRMGRLIDDLLEFARVGRVALKKTPVDANDLVTDVVQEMSPQSGDRHIAWRISALPSIVADRSLLRQVLVNLLSNAIKYTGKTAAARIEVGALPCKEPEDGAVFFVRDNGAGFDMQHAGKLFEPFNRLHTQMEFEGSGIGLSIVRSIIQRHGGKIWVDAQVGVGATVFFTLPD